MDNKPLLDMFLARPLGLLSLLDEESFFPKATDISFVEKLQRNLKKHRFFEPPKTQNSMDFVVVHFAGRVNYSAFGFLEKNRDSLSEAIKSLMLSSANPLIRTIFSLEVCGIDCSV